MALLEDENYDFFNFIKLRKIFIKYTEDFIKFPSLNNVNNFFKKCYEYPESKINKYKKYLKSIGRLKDHFDNNILEINNSKVDIGKGDFIRLLQEKSNHYNLSYRVLLCQTIPLFLAAFDSSVKDDARWALFKLLQYDTSGMQQGFIDMEEENKSLEPILNFNSLIDDFTSNLMTVILREINNDGYENRKEYLNGCLNIQILKYFCEEHNSHFQAFFFNNVFCSPKNVIVRYKARIKIKGKDLKRSESINLASSTQIKAKKNKQNSFYSSMLESKNDINSNYTKKASVFEYLLRVLGKVILLSNWMNNKNDALDDYYYDVYYTIIRFLIETIQSSAKENLNKVFSGEKKIKDFWKNF